MQRNQKIILQDDTMASEQRLRPSRRNSKKFRGVPGTAGRDFPTLGSIPMTSFSCIGTKAGFYADLEANCQVKAEEIFRPLRIARVGKKCQCSRFTTTAILMGARIVSFVQTGRFSTRR